MAAPEKDERTDAEETARRLNPLVPGGVTPERVEVKVRRRSLKPKEKKDESSQKREEDRAQRLRRERERARQAMRPSEMGQAPGEIAPRERKPAGEKGTRVPEIGPPTASLAAPPSFGEDEEPEEEGAEEEETEEETPPEENTPEGRARALDEEKEKGKKEKSSDREEESAPSGQSPRAIAARLGQEKKRASQAAKEAAIAGAGTGAGGVSTIQSLQRFYQLVTGVEAISLWGIVLAVLTVHVQVLAEFFFGDRLAMIIPPFELPLFGELFKMPLWMKMFLLFLLDLFLIMIASVMIAPFIMLAWIITNPVESAKFLPSLIVEAF